MPSPSYFRYYGESLDGKTGFCHCEVIAEFVTRQIWEFGGNLYWANQSACKDELHGFTDQPEWHNGDGTIDLVESDSESFTSLWQYAGGPNSSS